MIRGLSWIGGKKGEKNGLTKLVIILFFKVMRKVTLVTGIVCSFEFCKGKRSVIPYIVCKCFFGDHKEKPFLPTFFEFINFCKQGVSRNHVPERVHHKETSNLIKRYTYIIHENSIKYNISA